jgi:hypothetical protein
MADKVSHLAGASEGVGVVVVGEFRGVEQNPYKTPDGAEKMGRPRLVFLVGNEFIKVVVQDRVTADAWAYGLNIGDLVRCPVRVSGGFDETAGHGLPATYRLAVG